MTKAEAVAELTSRGISFDPDASAADLKALAQGTIEAEAAAKERESVVSKLTELGITLPDSSASLEELKALLPEGSGVSTSEQTQVEEKPVEAKVKQLQSKGVFTVFEVPTSLLPVEEQVEKTDVQETTDTEVTPSEPVVYQIKNDRGQLIMTCKTQDEATKFLNDANRK